MKTREWMIASRGWQARSVLACGDMSPLFLDATCRGVPKRRRVRARQKLAWIGVALFCFFILPSAFCLRASGQSYSIDWYKVAGGGGTSSNNQYTVSGTIGQHDAGGPMTGGGYSLTGGFWALISVVQTPGAPTLYLSHSGNTVKVYWQAVSGWNLQQNNNLTMPANWTDSTGVTTSNGTNYFNVTPPAGNSFFRLTKP